jgi:anti-sigma factor RsiW
VIRWRRRSLTCQELVELVTDYTEGALPPAERRRFERHVAACAGCATYVEQMAAIPPLVRAAAQPSTGLPPEAELSLLHAFRSWHDERR